MSAGTLPAKDNLVHMPGLVKVDKPTKRKWWIRAGIWLGAMMAAPPPKVWSFNPSVLTLLLVIAGLIASAGFYLGHQAAVQEQMQREIDKVAADEKRRKELEIYNSRQTDEKDGHAIKPKENKK